MVASRARLALTVVAIGASAAASFAPTPVRCDDVSDFYARKTVQLVIGYAPGGGYDDYARMLGRHISRHIPGHPTVVVLNMPGAGSNKAADYLYNRAPKDGTVFGGFARGIFLDPLLGQGVGIRFTPAKFGWLGSVSNDIGVCAFRSAAGIDSWADMERPVPAQTVTYFRICCLRCSICQCSSWMAIRAPPRRCLPFNAKSLSGNIRLDCRAFAA
jgi:tripartite-type tricarboxylate transporter receptor subunit TctC